MISLTQLTNIVAQQTDWPWPRDWQPDILPAICFGGFFIIGILLFVAYIAIAIWMYKDAEKRGEKGVLWVIVWLVGNIIGLIIWLIVRPSMDEVYRRREEERRYYRAPPSKKKKGKQE